MKYYLVIASYGTQPKNKLQKQVMEDLLKANRQLISEDKLESFKEYIHTVILQFNVLNPRCSPLTPTWWCYEHSSKDAPKDWHLWGCEFIDFKLLVSVEQKNSL